MKVLRTEEQVRVILDIQQLQSNWLVGITNVVIDT